MKVLAITTCLAAIAAFSLHSSSARAQQPAADPAISQRVTEIKKSLAQSQENLKRFEWIETVAVSVKDEEKSRTQSRCYYGEDGNLQKVPVASPPEPEKKRGIRGKIAEKKKEELSEYMQQAVQTVRSYIPPDPLLLQKSKDDGKVSIAILDPGKRVRLDFADYLEPGDVFRVEIDFTFNRLIAASVSTFLADKDGKRDPISLDIRFGSLKDGTTYAEQSTLIANAKELKVELANSGYRKMSD